MTQDFTIAYLADHPEHVETVARWYWEEWDRHEGWDLARYVAHARKGTHKDMLDMILVALDARNNCIGTIQGMRDAVIKDFAHLGPWVGSFYVDPAHRGERVAWALFTRLKEEIARLGIDVCYASTHNLHRLFLRNGGRVIGKTEYAGDDVCIYAFGDGHDVPDNGTRKSSDM